MPQDFGRYDKRGSLFKRFGSPTDPLWGAMTPPQAWFAIEPGSPSVDSNRTLNHFVRMRFRPDVNVDTKIEWVDGRGTTHELFVTGSQNVNQKDEELRLVCEETVT